MKGNPSVSGIIILAFVLPMMTVGYFIHTGKHEKTKPFIFSYITLYGIVWGMFLGSLAGFFYNLIFLAAAFLGLPGLVAGLVFGIVLGIINGLSLGIMTVQQFYPLKDVDQYRQKSASLISGITLCVGLLFAFVLFPSLLNTTMNGWILVLSTPIVILATVSAIYANKHVTSWYINMIVE